MTWSLPVIPPAMFVASKAAAKTALHQVRTSVQSAPAPYAMTPSKVAAAADAVERLANLVENLQQTHGHTVKSAQRLIEAVKLAQDGLLDVGEIFTHAGIETSTATTVAPVGKIAGRAPEAQEATPPAGTNPLEDFLRSKRG